MRKFEKISFEQFKKDVCDDLELYNNFCLPRRSTKKSAGYDFVSLVDYVLKPNECIKIPLGIKVMMENDDVLFLLSRSSIGYKYNVRLVNSVGVIDADYYNNESNEGHMSLKLFNHGNEELVISKGMKIVQGVFVKYLVVDDEEEIDNNRTGGIGSTNK